MSVNDTDRDEGRTSEGWVQDGMDGRPKGMGGGMVVMEVLTEGCLIGETMTYGWFGGSVEQEQG